MATQGPSADAKPVPDSATSGLEGIVVARTELSDVDGQRGKLTIRGYDVEEIATHATFEEAAYLLWHGALPTRGELDGLCERLARRRSLPDEASAALEAAATRMEPMDALRFAVAALTSDDPSPGDESREANLRRAEWLVARVPVIVGTYERARRGQPALEPREDLGIAANLLYQVRGEE